MPDFTFTSPEGKSYTVTGPEGATKEQAFQVLQQQIAGGTAKEDTAAPTSAPASKPKTASERAKDAIVNINAASPLNHLAAGDKPVPTPTVASAAKSIAGSTAFGGIVGALSPEIVTGLGMAASFIPYVGEVVGPALVGAGGAMRAGRLAEAGLGAVSGLTSETAGQAVEASGGTKGQAEAARLAGGMLTPSAGAVAGFVAKPAKLAWGLAQKVLGAEQDIPKAVSLARENLAKLEEAGQPQTAMHAMLQKGVEADRQAAEKAADAVMADAHKRAAGIAQSDAATATRLVDEARTRADQIRAEATQRANVLEKASAGKTATANRVLAQAAPELAKVGQVSELSDIGNTLRQAATAKQGAEIEARNTAYKATVAERDAIVKAKEAAGQSIDNSPSIVALKKDLATKLGRVRGFEQTVDPGVRRGYQQIEDALTRKSVDTGLVDANGNPIKQQFKTSFEALDHVRRRLGDVIKGQAVEGYEAIGKNAAQKMYAQISKAQEEFVGETAGAVEKVKPNFEPDETWLRKQVSVGKDTILADAKTLEGAKDIGNGLKLTKDFGFGGAYKVYAPSGIPSHPWKVVGKLSYKDGKIVNLATSPEMQRQGISQKLIEEAAKAKQIDPNLNPEDVSQAGAAAINRFRETTAVKVNVQRKLQSEYAEATGDLTRFAGKAGKKLTAMDRLDPEKFSGDAKALPKAFFNSQQSIRDAKELTGNPQLVDRQAADYAARSMQGMSAKQARAWVRDNQDWMREVPGLSQRSNAYAQKLTQIERVNEGLGKRAALKAKEAEATREGAAAASEKERQTGLEEAGKVARGTEEAKQRVLAEGSKAASAAREQAFAPAKGLENILKGGEAPEAVRNLLLNGKPEQTRRAAAMLAGEPGGQKVLEESVRQSMRNMTEGNLRQQWTERIRPMLSDGKMIPPERLKALDDDVNRLLRAYKGSDRLTMVQRHIAAAIGTVGGQVPNQ